MEGGRRRKGLYWFGSPHKTGAEPLTRFNVSSSVISSSPPSTGPVWVEQRTSIFSNTLQKETAAGEDPTSSRTPEAAQQRLPPPKGRNQPLSLLRSGSSWGSRHGGARLCPRSGATRRKMAFGSFLLHEKELPRPDGAAGQAGCWGKAHRA